MKIPITLIPQGRVAQDPNLGFRVPRLTAPVVRNTVTTITATPTSIGFRDNFDGEAGDDLTVHRPNLGGPYAPSTGGTLISMVLDGASNLLPSGSGGGDDPASAIAGTLPDTYTISVLFNPTILDGNERTFIDIGARLAATDTWLINPSLEYDDGWSLYSIVQNAAGTTLFSERNFIPSGITTGALNRLTVDVSPSGTVWKINGVVITSDTNVPDAIPDSVAFENSTHDDTASKILIDEISLLP